MFFLGFGVFATQEYEGGEFIIEYAGERITIPEALEREERYSDTQMGNFLYFFKENW